MKIAAVIVLYNPNKDRLLKSIESIYNQVDKIYVYNNGCNSAIIESLKHEKLQILGTGKNEGLACALNNSFEEAYKNDYEWIITLDQDSIVPDEMTEKFIENYNEINDSKIAIICPRFIDKRREEVNYEIVSSEKISFIDVCITSASLTNIKIWKEIGGFDDILFIDLIDNDYCKRIKLNNYKILRLNNVILDQEKGEITKKSNIKVKFYLSIANIIKIFNLSLAKNISKLTYKKNVVPMRVYYTNRNIIYLNKKYKNFGGIGHIGYVNYNCNTYFGFNICFNFPSIIRAKNKIKVLKSVFWGIIDGKKIANKTIPIERK